MTLKLKISHKFTLNNRQTILRFELTYIFPSFRIILFVMMGLSIQLCIICQF